MALQEVHYELRVVHWSHRDSLAVIPSEVWSQINLVLLDSEICGHWPYPILAMLREKLQGNSVPFLAVGCDDRAKWLSLLQNGVLDYIAIEPGSTKPHATADGPTPLDNPTTVTAHPFSLPNGMKASAHAQPKPLWVLEGLARIQNHMTLSLYQHRLRTQATRAVTAGAPTALLADLQRTLRRQSEQLQGLAQQLQAQNEQLQREITERTEAEVALRKEQQKSEQLLLNILPRAIMEQLKHSYEIPAERFESVTILFADIVNFSHLAAEMSPLALVSWLNRIFSEFDLLAERYGLEKIKTIGDAYMVAGGLPLPQSNHAEAVMEMAIAMQSVANRIAQQGEYPLQLRIGINTGPVVAGVIGISKFSYDLWGDAVNIASRMETQGVPGKIQITKSTYEHLCQKYHFTQTGQLLVKGRGYMTTYQYEGRRAE